jgi:DNA-binding transcriptional MerR regulator
MRTLKTSEAAALLNVSANTLRAWEDRFGYPRPQRSPGRHRLYAYAEIDALRGALQDGLSASSAVSVLRDSVSTDVLALVTAMTSFKRARADAVMEASLSIGSLEHAVEGILLEALGALQRRKGPTSACWAFALGWATDWLRRTQRLVAVPDQHGAVIIGDATAGATDMDAAHIRALELFCARAGIDALTLPVRSIGALHDALAAIPAEVIVVAGAGPDDEVARWLYAVRSATMVRGIAYFARPRSYPTPSRAVSLSESPSEAQCELAAMVQAGSVADELSDLANGRGSAAAAHRSGQRAPDQPLDR